MSESYELNATLKVILGDMRSSAWLKDNGIDLSEDDAKQTEANKPAGIAKPSHHQDAKQPTPIASSPTTNGLSPSQEEKLRG